MMVEPVDAISDNCEPPIAIYPVRLTAEQVAGRAAAFESTVERKMFISNCLHLPRMLCVPRKSRPAG
jgi:hypothetical protein